MPEKENDMSGLVLYAVTPDGYEEMGPVRDVSEAINGQTEMTMDEAALEAAQAWSITQEQMEIVVEAFGKFAKAVEAAIRARIEAIIKAAAFIQALKSGNFSWTQEDADKTVKDFWEGVRRAGELVNMHQEEVLERKEQRKRFEQENRAKIRQYQTFCMGRQRLRRTEKRYREWRGPAR